MGYEAKCRGRIQQNEGFSRDHGNTYTSKAPGVNLPCDFLTEDELAAMSSECITVTPPKEGL